MEECDLLRSDEFKDMTPTQYNEFWNQSKQLKASTEELKAMKIPRILDTSLEVRSSGADVRFDGSGMIVVNPPYKLESELRTILPWLSSVLEFKKGSGSWAVNWLAGE